MGMMRIERPFKYAERRRETGCSNTLDLVMGHRTHVEGLAIDNIDGNTQEVRISGNGCCQVCGCGNTG